MPEITFHLDDEYEEELYDMLKYEGVDSVKELFLMRMHRHDGSKRFMERLTSIGERMFPNGVQKPDEGQTNNTSPQ